MFEIDDHIIVGRVLAGDRNAFGMLVSKYQVPIYNLMVRSVPSAEDAAELAQDVFLKAFARIETYRPSGNKFFSWLYAIGLNTARDYLRRIQRWKIVVPHGLNPYDEQGTPGGDGGADDSEQTLADMQTLRQVLALLPMNQRETLILKYRYGMTMQEIADIFDISASAVKMRIHRGLAEMRRCMVNED